MCWKCGYPGMATHWSEAVVRTAPERSDARRRRLQILQTVLAPYGVKVENSALGSALRLIAPGRGPELAEDLDTLWPLVEKLLGAPLDPLAAHFTVDAGKAS